MRRPLAAAGVTAAVGFVALSALDALRAAPPQFGTNVVIVDATDPALPKQAGVDASGNLKINCIAGCSAGSGTGANNADGVTAIAPTIASAFGGPLAGLAVTALEQALGVAPGNAASDPKSFEAKLAGAIATPEQVLALRQADIAFKQFCLDNDLQIVRADNADRADARARQTALHDHAPTVLALLVTVGFFGMLGVMAFHDLPIANRDMLTIMLGSLGAAWVAVVSYYFGSSAGSRAKDSSIAALAKS